MSDDTTNIPPVECNFSPEHRDYLTSQAVDVSLAQALGVRSLVSREDTTGLPEPWCNFANLPALLFPWTGPDGRTEYQVRPDSPTTDQRGRARKYMFRKGAVPVLWAVRPSKGADRLVIVEGTKQCLAAASYAPAGVGVYGMAGCRMWQVDGSPIPDLAVVDGRDVVIILDADAAGNADVYTAGVGLAEALAAEGALSVKFGRLPASGKAGLDDVLASREPQRRAGYLARIIDSAKPKPADTKPKLKKKGSQAPEDSERVTIICNRDRFAVINDLTEALINRWDGRDLFNHGGVMSWLKGQGMHPIDRGTARDLIQETAVTVDEINDQQGIRYNFTWPDSNSIAATLSRAEKFSPLDRISHAPFVRPDGTIVTEPGYDEATRTVLVPDPVMEGIQVPESPTPDQIEAARELIMTEWLGDFPFGSDADRANALALVVTPAVRGLVPRVPLAVVDGLQMGVGKNLLADSVLTVYTGEPARPMNFVDEKDELRKQITSAFRTGAEFFVFDEAHTIEGAALAQALTASTWQDRILGVSTMAEFPNRVTWMSLGNNVQVRGDLTRRVYRIALRPDYANPQDRPATSFRHPGQSGLDLGSWTRKHRRELMIAILTLVRAWFAAGQPCPDRGISFGSFETWERYAGGIVQTAGLPGFLGNLKVWRSESDFDSQYWAGHLGWLKEQFGGHEFRTAEVRSKALTDLAGFMAPPKLDDPADKGFSKALGESYARLRGRRYEGMYLERMGSVKGHVSMWVVKIDRPPVAGHGSPQAGGTPDGAGPADSPRVPQDTGVYADQHESDRGCVSPPGGHESGSFGDETGSELSGPGAVPKVRGSGRVAGPSSGSPDPVRSDAPQAGPVTDTGSDERDSGQGVDPLTHSVEDRVSLSGCGCSRVMKVYCHDKNCQGGADVDVAGIVHGQAPGMLAEMERALAEQGLDSNGEARGWDESGAMKSYGAQLVTLDLETGDASDLYRHGPGYVRLAGAARDDQPAVVAGTERGVVRSAVTAVRYGRTLTGHNIMAFDLPALVQEGALTLTEVHAMAKDGRLFDGLLAARHLDPPMAREKGVDAARKHDLDSLVKRYGLGEKIGAIKALKKKYGGWAGIPTSPDDPDGATFREYLIRDVELSRSLYHVQLAELGGTVPEYLVREHRVAALATQISVNGFRVDVPELERRVADIEKRKAEAMRLLANKCGIPTADAKGNPYKSPLNTKAGKIALTRALNEAGATSIWMTEKSGEIMVGADHMLHLASEYAHLPAVVDICKNVYRIVSARTVYETIHNHLVEDRVHPSVSFKQSTGRWSLTEPGLTVMGKRGGRHVERAVFLPDPGQVIVTVDLSQVDMRAVAGLSQDAAYIEMLRHEDPHSQIALALFGDVGRREQAKAIGHGWNYGRGIQAISQKEEIDPALVRTFDQSMRERFGRLVQWQEEVRRWAASGELLDNGFGRPMRPDPQRSHTQGPALMGQGAARDIMMTGLLRLADKAPETLPMLRAQVHDEIVLSVPEADARDVARTVVDALSFQWRGVPITADAGPFGSDWSLCYIKA